MTNYGATSSIDQHENNNAVITDSHTGPMKLRRTTRESRLLGVVLIVVFALAWIATRADEDGGANPISIAAEMEASPNLLGGGEIEEKEYIASDDDFTGDHIEVSYHDFLDFDSIQKILKEKDIHTTSSQVMNYVPRKIKIELNRDLVKGSIGPSAEDGHIAFNLIRMADHAVTYTSSLLVIMRLDGTLEKVYNTYNVGSGDTHFCGLKLRDPETFILGGDVATSELGQQYILDWKSGEFTKLGNGTLANCHDIQWAFEGDNIWQPGNHSEGTIELKDAQTGQKIKSIQMAPFAKDINHVGLIGHDTQAIASSRMTDAIIKVDVEQEEIMWIGGGVAGHLELVTINGETMANGSAMFSGQHNAEYFGEDEYMMFDNQYETGNASRMLVVHIDEIEKKMEEKWEFSFHEYPWGYSPYFGDNDRLPTGNLLSSFWPLYMSGEDHLDIMYEARAAEVVRETHELAWDMKVYGNNGCEKRVCERSNAEGWKMYSVERFYDSPQIYNETCDLSDMKVTFYTVNNFKQNNEYEGSYNITGPGVVGILSQGVFNFSAHWRQTEVTAILGKFDPDSSSKVKLFVTNQWGDHSLKTIKCN